MPYFFTISFNTKHDDWDEKWGRAYAYWTPREWLTAKVEYEYERFDRGLELPGEESILYLRTQKVPLSIRVFHPSGLSAGLKGTYIYQKGEFTDLNASTTWKDSDNFWVMDASITYRLPKRLGIITVEARNLLDEEFKFQDTDQANPRIYSERLILGRFTIAF